MHARTTALPALAVCLVALACNGDNAEDFHPGSGPLLLSGTSMVTPSIEGSWVLTSTPAVSGCGALNVLYATEAVLTITQAGNALEFALADACGRPIPGGKGQVDAGGIVALVSKVDRALTATCTLRVEQARTGSVEMPPNVFSGTDVLTLTASDEPGVDNCDPSLPCSVSGAFTATRCSRGGCDVTCVP